MVAFPSWGFGHWNHAGGYARIDAVVQAVQAELPIDPQRVVIGGLSAGGIGALGAFVQAPERFQGCLVLSGVPRTPVPEEPFVGRPLLLIQGEQDERLLAASARNFAKRIVQAGGSPRTLFVPDAGHFLLLTHQEEVLQAMGSWLREDLGAGGSK